MKLLVDTNVYLELLLKREKYDSVLDFFKMCISRKNQTCITTMSLRDIGYIAHRFVHDNEISRQMQFHAYEISSEVVSISPDSVIDSLYSDNSDYEDSLQSIAAEEALCDAIITFNKKDYKKGLIPVFTPEEICNIWKKNPRIII